MPLIVVEHLDDPRLEVYRNLKATNLTRGSGLFVVEGKRLVQRLIQSEFDVDSVLIGERHLQDLEDDLPENRPVYVATSELLNEVIGFKFHQGALACGRRQPNMPLETLIQSAGERLTLVACSNVIDQENLGTIVRVAAAFGVDGVLLGQGCADPFSRRVLRVSMGSALSLPIVESSDLAADLQQLAERWDFQLAATVLDGDAEPLENATRPDRLALLFGNETDGLDRRLMELCHRRLTIPMQLGTDSLNVGVAAGIFLYHFMREKTFHRSAAEFSTCPTR